MRGVFKNFKRPAALALIAVMVAGVGITFVTPRPANAQSGGDWCQADPILSIDGTTVNVIAGVMGNAADVRANVKHAHFRIFLPYGVDARIVGYTGDYFTESAEIVRDRSLTYAPGRTIEMRIEVSFLATATMPAMIAVSVDGSRQQIIGGGNTSTGVRGRYPIRP
jgi:hypothetical protein